MATSAWLHGPSAMRLTEALVSALKEQRPEYVPALLASYREHGVFSTQGAAAVSGLVGFSNAKLGSGKTRFEGLCLLSMLVKDSSSDLFQQHCLSWLRSLQQVIQSQAPVQTVQLAVNVLKDLLQYSSQLSELAREVGLNSILGTLTSLLGLKPECELAAMEGMTACMTYYPRACGSLRDKLGAYFLSKMDSTNRKTQEMACQCYGHLPCLGGLLDRGVGAGRAEAWTNQIHCLLATANGLLTQIYHGSETAEGVLQYQGPGVELGFPHLDQSDPLLLLQLQHRYTAVCLALKHTLRVDPATAVRLPVRRILNLVCRALAVSSKSINLTGDGSVRLLVLPVIHTNTLEVLSGLITAVRSGLVQYAVVLQRLFSQTLSGWTPPPEASVGQQRGYSSVRASVYRTLELWIQVAGASSSIFQGSPSHSELLFSHLLSDITPAAESIKLRGSLTTDVVPGGKPGPRRTKQLVIVDGVGTSLQRKGDIFTNQDTCLSALRALRRIIQTSGTLLKDDIHKRLHEVVLPLCLRLQQQQSSSGGSEPTGGVSGPYSSALARGALYRLLLALVLVPSPCWPAPLACAVSILSNGRTDRNLKVSAFCAEALTICNSILHPRTPSISLPLPPLTLKPTPNAPVLPPAQGPAPGLTLPTLLGSPTPGPHFSTRHSLGLGPSSLLGSLENHLSLIPGLPGQGPAPGDMLLSSQTHHQPELGPPEGQRPVFVRYDKEETEDVEISLASDSDDSVVIVPPGMLTLENQHEEGAAAATPHNMISSAPADAGVGLQGGDSVAMAPTTAAATTVDGTSLSNNLATPSPLLATSTTPINSFPPSNASVVSLVPPLNSSSLVAPPGGLGDSLPGRPQLQQMLMQPSAGGQPPPMGLPLQMHQLQNQLSQPGRHLHPHPHPAPPTNNNNEDSAVININSTDEEEEDEEDMEDDEELEEEEEEEEGLDEEDEEEEVSDLPEDFYDGEEYEDYDEEEGEELEEEEEEEEEDGGIPPLEGSEDKTAEGGMEEGKVLRAAVDEGGVSGFSVEGGDSEGGIEEIQTNRGLFSEDRMKVQEVESIGVLEATREEEEDPERMDDPTMPQIVCVTGGALEDREEEEPEEEVVGEGDAAGPGGLQEGDGSWEQRDQDLKLSEDQRASQSVQESTAEAAHEASASDTQASGHQDDEPAADHEEDSAAAAALAGETLTGTATEMVTDAEEEEGREVQQEASGGGGGGGGEKEGDGEEEKGVKRKREEAEEEAGESTEKKKMDDEAMASMLADFVACPPDDEDGASGSNRS